MSETGQEAPNLEQQLSELAANLGYIETPDLQALKAQALEKAVTGEAEANVQAYQDEAMKLIGALEGRVYTAAQIGFVVSVASLRQAVGQPDRFTDEIDKALTMAENQGFEPEAAILAEILRQSQPAPDDEPSI